MKKLIISILVSLSFLAITHAGPIMPIQGGTGVSTNPAPGIILIGNSSGRFEPALLSTAAPSGGSGVSVYNATSTAGFPYGLSGSTAVISGQVFVGSITAYGTVTSTSGFYGDGSHLTGVSGSGGVSVYPATAAASFPFSLTASSITSQGTITSTSPVILTSNVYVENLGVNVDPKKSIISKIEIDVSTIQPKSSLYVANTDAFILSNNNANTSVRVISAGNNGIPGFSGTRARGTPDNPKTVLSGDTVFTFAAQAFDGFQRQSIGAINMIVDGSTNQAIPGRVEIRTTNQFNTTSNVALLIDSQQRMGVGTSSPRGSFDAAGVLQTTQTTSVTLSETVGSGSGNYADDGSVNVYRVYSYRTWGGVTVYSPNYVQKSITLGNTFNVCQINVSWSAVAGATGYRIVMDNPQYELNFGQGAFGYSYDTTATSFIDGDGTEGSFNPVATVTPVIATLPTGLYVTSNTGDVVIPASTTVYGTITSTSGFYGPYYGDVSHSINVGGLIYSATATPNFPYAFTASSAAITTRLMIGTNTASNIYDPAKLTVLSTSTNYASKAFEVIVQSTNTSFWLQNSGHIHSTGTYGTLPYVTGPGGSFIVQGSDDNHGSFFCTAGGSCSLNFGYTWANKPTCVISFPGANVNTYTVTTTAITSSFAGISATLDYICLGH